MQSTSGRGPVFNRAFLYIGYGCFLATFSGAPFNVDYISGWVPSLLAVLGYYGGLAAACLVIRYARSDGFAIASSVFAPLIYALVTLLVLALEWLLGGPRLGNPLLVALSAILGCAASIPLMFWYECLFSVYRSKGRLQFISLQMGATLISVGSLCVLVVVLRVVPQASTILFSLEVLVTTFCQVWYMRLSVVSDGRLRPSGAGGYSLSPYSTAMLIDIGVVWGLLCGAYSYSSAEHSMAEFWQPYAASLAAVALCAFILVRRLGRGSMRFGSLIRLIVLVAGVALVAMPLVQRFVPDVVMPLCQTVYVLADTSIVLFTVDICREQGYPVAAVLPVNFGVFAVAVCLGGLAFWFVMSSIGGQVAWECLALLGAAAAVIQVPFLPSRSSDAGVFALKELPENESYELFIARRRKEATAKYGLTPRESDVLERLLRNMTRQQIADEMHLSEWTVRDRIRSIYKKIGVGSYKEFIGAIEGDGR